MDNQYFEFISKRYPWATEETLQALNSDLTSQNITMGQIAAILSESNASVVKTTARKADEAQAKAEKIEKRIEKGAKKAKGAIKDVIGRYTYVEAYSTKREILEQEIEAILNSDFDSNYVALDFVEIADINLPQNIAIEITNKETQKQRNQTAKEKQKEEEYLANARIEKARGDSSLVVSARFKAEAISLEAEQISKNPQYIELKKWESWDGNGSPYGTGNVFGDNAISILKQ